MAGTPTQICVGRNARNKVLPNGQTLGSILTGLSPGGTHGFSNVSVHENEDGSYFVRVDVGNESTLITIDPSGNVDGITTVGGLGPGTF